MTVSTKLHQTLTGLESAKTQLETFALDTEDKQAKATFTQLSQVLEQQVIPPLRQRVNYVEQQEPQYQVKQQAMQQAAQSSPTQSGLTTSASGIQPGAAHTPGTATSPTSPTSTRK